MGLRGESVYAKLYTKKLIQVNDRRSYQSNIPRKVVCHFGRQLELIPILQFYSKCMPNYVPVVTSCAPGEGKGVSQQVSRVVNSH